MLGPLQARGTCWAQAHGRWCRRPPAIPTRTTQGLSHLSFSWSLQGPVNNHVTGKGPGQGTAALEVHQDHEGNGGLLTEPVPQALPLEVGSPRLPAPAPALKPPCPSLQHLRKLNNFNSYLAILSALDSAPIRRLEWQKQTSEVSGSDRPCSGQEQRPGPGSLLRHQPARTGLSFLCLVSSHCPPGRHGWGWGLPAAASCCPASLPQTVGLCV